MFQKEMQCWRVKDTLYKTKIKELTLKAKEKDTVYNATSKTLQQLYFGHINCNQSIQSRIAYVYCNEDRPS